MSEYQSLRAKLPDHITESDVQKIMRAILSENAPWDWFARARVPFPFAVHILRELQAGGYIKYVGDKTELTAFAGVGLMRALAQRVVRVPGQEGIDAHHHEDRMTGYALDRMLEPRDVIVVVAGLGEQRADPLADAHFPSPRSGTHAHGKVVRHMDLERNRP